MEARFHPIPNKSRACSSFILEARHSCLCVVHRFGGSCKNPQIRTRVLNGEWEETFRTWYPGFRAHAQPTAA